jgi:hypothetical protein
MDMYGEKVASASALIREFAKTEYYHYFQGDPERAMEAFIAMQDAARAESAARIAELERQVEHFRSVSYGLREAIFPRKIQDSKAWRAVPVSHLGHIMMLIDPPAVEVDGKTMVFVNPNAAEVLHRISDLVRAMMDEPLPAAPAPSEVL